VAQSLRAWFPQVEQLTVPGVGHLLQLQNPQPIVRGVAAFLARHAMKGTELQLA
jgi:pimeloyl-ACP methyl ester carboxylesterase